MRCDGAAVSDNLRRCPRCGHVHSFVTTHDKKPAPDVGEWNEILIDRGQRQEVDQIHDC